MRCEIEDYCWEYGMDLSVVVIRCFACCCRLVSNTVQFICMIPLVRFSTESGLGVDLTKDAFVLMNTI